MVLSFASGKRTYIWYLLVFFKHLFDILSSSLTDTEASPDHLSIGSASGAVSARQKGHVKSASTSHALPLDLPPPPSMPSAAAAAAPTIEQLLR